MEAQIAKVEEKAKKVLERALEKQTNRNLFHSLGNPDVQGSVSGFDAIQLTKRWTTRRTAQGFA